MENSLENSTTCNLDAIFIKFFASIAVCDERKEKRLGWKRALVWEAKKADTSDEKEEGDKKNSIVESEEVENCLCVEYFPLYARRSVACHRCRRCRVFALNLNS